MPTGSEQLDNNFGGPAPGTFLLPVVVCDKDTMEFDGL